LRNAKAGLRFRLGFARVLGQADNEAVRNKLGFLLVFAAALCWSGSVFSQRAAATPTQPPPEARVDINHAPIDELLKVPGMTRTWAVRIIRFRPYRTKIDLIDHGVVTSQVYDRIKDCVIAHRDEQ
jgi:DNA uptake protein ComE-like DNA-binding protein